MNGKLSRALVTFALSGLLFLAILLPSAHAADRYLRVNQVGYLPSDIKVAVAFSNDDLSGLNFSLISGADGQTVFGPQSLGADQGSYSAFAHNYRLDFSSFTGTGSFKVTVSDGSAESYYFTISPASYAGSHEDILKFFRAQRCGYNPFLDAVCHTHPVSDPDNDAWLTDLGQYADLSGGWHDAGDYIKFLLTTSNVLDLILFTYKENKGKFADNYLADGTAGSNGIPDLLDEAKYGLDWVLKLHPAPGKLYYQVGGEEDHYNGWRLPPDDSTDYDLGGYRPAYHGIGANIAGRSAAALAMAYLIWRDDLGDGVYADTCFTAATELYQLAQANLVARDSNPDWFYNETTFYDDLELAAVELYKAVGDWSYLSDAVYYSSLAGSSWGWFDWGGINSLAHYELYPHADSATRSQLKTYLQQDLNSNLANALSNPFRFSSIYGWGSASVLTGTVVMCDLYKKLFPEETTYDALHDEVRDYLLGRNQWGVSWVVGLGDNYTQDPHHQVADITGGEITGAGIGGPMEEGVWNGMGITLSGPDEYADFQSPAAVYYDDVADWATNEPTIWQSSLTLCLLSHLAPPPPTIVSCLGDSVTHGYPYADNGNPQYTYPNRLQGMLDIEYGEGSYTVYNHGVNGYKAEDVIADLEQPDALSEDPDYVLLKIGGNDLAEADIFTILQIINETTWEVQSCVNLIKAHTNADGSHPEVIVSAFIPNLLEDGWGTIAVGLYNDSLESNLTGHDLWFTDNWDDFYDSETGEAKTWLMYDSTHPNIDGYEVMAGNWLGALQNLLPTPTPTPSVTPTPTRSPTPSVTPTPSLTPTPTPTVTTTPSVTPTPTASPTPSVTPAPSETPSPSPSPTPFTGIILTVYNSVTGTSPLYLGGNEGGGFQASDLVDCGANLYRIWSTMGELEYYDDDWVADGYPGWPDYPAAYYGSPAFNQVTADVNIVPWAVWDDAFTRARWTTAVPFKDLLDGCQATGAEPLLVLRTKGPDEGWIDWIPNAPDGSEFWEEWKEYCFAVAYWCNVRNSYGVTHFQIHNEPDLVSQGWQGTQAQYVQLIESARDALEFANTIAGLPVYLHAPVVSNYSSSYISYCLDNADSHIDVVDYHVYDKYHSLPASIQTVKQTIIDHNPDGVLEPVWITEWGDLDLNYDTLNRGLLTASQLYQMAAGGVEGSAIFMFYDWGSDESGLIDEAGFTPYDSYYAFRLMLRGLKGGKDILDSDSSDPAKQIMATREGGNLYLLAVGVGNEVQADLSAFALASEVSDLYEYSASFKDQISSSPVIAGGVVSFSAPTEAAVCLVVPLSEPSPSPTPAPQPSPSPSPSPSLPPPTLTPTPSSTQIPPASPTPTPSPPAMPTPTCGPPADQDKMVLESGDYDGDGTADIGIFRESSGLWAVRGLTITYYGMEGDRPVPGYYVGDGTTDIAIFRPATGLWAVRWVTRRYYGMAGDIPVPGDYDGDGVAGIGIFRPSSGLWAIRGQTRTYYGMEGDWPLPGDYDGDGSSDVAIFRPSTGLWAVRGGLRLYFGATGDWPVPGDYDGDATWETGVYRPSTGLWALRGVTRVYFGTCTDWPLPADYRGDGEDGVGIFRPPSGLWAIKNLTRVYFGKSGDKPVVR